MIYLDNAATTPVCDVAKQVIIDNLNNYYNVNSSYEAARQLRVKVEQARESIAQMLGANTDELYFTSGGSEGNSWVTKLQHPTVFICSEFEHHSVLNNPKYKQWVAVDTNGLIDMENLHNILHQYEATNERPLVSCMMVNNEIGTIQPIKEIAKLCHEHNALLHVDAVQAVGHIPVDFKELNVDVLTFSAHKFGGIKGVGGIVIRDGLEIKPVIYGGSQESGLRGSTTNVLGILSMEAALRFCIENMEEHNKHITMLRNKLAHALLSINGVSLNGSYVNRVASNINVCIAGVRGTALVSTCDLFEIAISSGSACNEGINEPSHVLKAIMLDDKMVNESIRITLGYQNTEEEIKYVCEMMPKLIERLRNNK